MVVLPVDEDDVGGRAAQRLGGREAAEAGTDDDDPRTALGTWPFLAGANRG